MAYSGNGPLCPSFPFTSSQRPRDIPLSTTTPHYPDPASAHAAGLQTEADLPERQWIPPRTPPAGWVGETPYYPAAAVEPLYTRKEWKFQGRRVPQGTEAVRELTQEGQTVVLYAHHQTISEEEHLARQHQELEQRIAAWEKVNRSLLRNLAEWRSDLPLTPAPQAEERLRQLLARQAEQVVKGQGLARSHAHLGVPLPQADPAPWEEAREAYRLRRLQETLAGSSESCDSELTAEIHQRLLAEENRHDDPSGLFPYWKFFGRFHKALEEGRFAREISDATRIQDFHRLFPAREMRRHFTLYLGPTNSGKTYQALQRLGRAASGIYLAPLRLLALEVSETLKGWGVPCSMVTGEERHVDPLADHTASTVEMLPLHKRFQMAVIDEVQMVGDPDRGWAWTQAILGVQADEVALVGAPEALPAVEKLLALTGEPYEVVRTQRLSPLDLLERPLNHFEELEPGTAVVAFSRAGVLHLKGEMEHHLGQRVAVVYGALPPEVRREQARLFASGEAPFLAATDAIGMGLNLPIRTLLFSQDRKLIDRQEHPLTPMEVRQIAGRAGRFGKNEIGFVGSFRIPMTHIRQAFLTDPKPVERALLAPNLDHLLAIAAIQGPKRPQLAQLFNLFVRTVRPDPLVYRLCDLEDQTVLARIADRHPSMELSTRFALSAAPVPLRTIEVVSAFETMVETVARDRELSLDRVLPFGRVRGDRQLGLLEAAMQVVNLYCWLHYRFPTHFPELREAEGERRRINQEINALLGRERRMIRQCSRCEAPLPPFSQHPFPICDACYAKGGRSARPARGEGRGRQGGGGDWRRHLPPRVRERFGYPAGAKGEPSAATGESATDRPPAEGAGNGEGSTRPPGRRNRPAGAKGGRHHGGKGGGRGRRGHPGRGGSGGGEWGGS